MHTLFPADPPVCSEGGRSGLFHWAFLREGVKRLHTVDYGSLVPSELQGGCHNIYTTQSSKVDFVETC